MSINHVKIQSNGLPEGTRAFIDGVELTNVTRIEFAVGTRDSMLATITAVVYVDELDLDGHMRVERQTRQVARMTDLEALERAMLLIGEAGIAELKEHAIKLLSQGAIRVAGSCDVK